MKKCIQLLDSRRAIVGQRVMDALEAEPMFRRKNGERMMSVRRAVLKAIVDAGVPVRRAHLKDVLALGGDKHERVFIEQRVSDNELKRALESLEAREFISTTYSNDYTLLQRVSGYAALLKESDSVAKEIERRGNEDRNVELLESIPGIGRQTAVQLMSMIVDISRFVDPEKLCAYFGMAPRVRDSGGKEHHGRMTKSGDPMMRSIMERVTLSHIRYCDSTITAYFQRKKGEMGAKKALMSAARKMLAMIHAVLKRGTPFTA